MATPKRQIPPDRKALYYLGMALAGLGAILFISVFITAAANFGNFDNFEERARSSMFQAISGMVLMVAGIIVMNIGARGWAGSGVVLDPQKARKDVEPWSRMGGGIIGDALSEVGVVKKIEDRLDSPKTEPEVKIRCPKCRALNDETAKFCNQCGTAL